MPKYEITSPDGTKYQVNAPDGATEADAISYVQTKFAAPAKADAPDIYAQTAAQNSTMQNLLAGIGGGMTSLYTGGKQLLGMDKPGEVDEQRRLMAGLNTTTAGTIGDIIGQGALAAPAAFIPGVNTYIGAGALGAGLGALQPAGQGERPTNMALGAGGGVIGKFAGDKIVKLLSGRSVKVPPTSTPNAAASGSATSQAAAANSATQIPGAATITGTGGGYNFGTVGEDVSAGLNVPQSLIAKRGKRLGMQMTPGQASGSKALQQLESKLESQPMTSGRFSQIKANNQTVINRAAANAIGETSNTLDSAVLSQAKSRIGNIYKMVADKTPRQIEPDQFVNRLAGIETEFEGLTPGSIADHPLVKRLLTFGTQGQATGEQLQTIASKLGNVANSQMTSASGDRQLGMALFKVKDMADDLLASGLKGDTAKAFESARGQYRNLMLLTQRGGVINPSTGNISGNALAGLLQQKDKTGYLFGGNKSPLYDAARFAQAFKPIVGDSGTATRMPLPSPTDFVLSLPFNLATRAYTSAPVTGLAGSIGSTLNRGLAPQSGRAIAPWLPQLTESSGALLGARAGR